MDVKDVDGKFDVESIWICGSPTKSTSDITAKDCLFVSYLLRLVTGQMKVLVGECFDAFANCISQINMFVSRLVTHPTSRCRFFCVYKDAFHVGHTRHIVCAVCCESVWERCFGIGIVTVLPVAWSAQLLRQNACASKWRGVHRIVRTSQSELFHMSRSSQRAHLFSSS